MTNDMHHLTTCTRCDAPLEDEEQEACANCIADGEAHSIERYKQVVAFQLRG